VWEGDCNIHEVLHGELSAVIIKYSEDLIMMGNNTSDETIFVINDDDLTKTFLQCRWLLNIKKIDSVETIADDAFSDSTISTIAEEDAAISVIFA
jgi:hypothetical protein